MKHLKNIKEGTILRNITRYIFLSLCILGFAFALLSGAEQYGGGIIGILKNIPNTWPWFMLFILSYIAWKWELVGGIIMLIVGLSVLYIYNFPRTNFLSSASLIALLIIVLALLFIWSWYLNKAEE